MQLFFVLVFFLFTLTRSSNVENEGDLLASVDIIAFSYSQQVSQHWDCPQISYRARKAEEVRVWRMVIPDARIEEKVSVGASKALQFSEEYKWIKDDMFSSDSTTVQSDLFMQNSVLLGMRKPNFDGSAAPVKLLYSKSKQANQDALSVVLPQLEQSKDKIMDWMAHNQASLPIIPNMTPNVTEPLTNHRLQVPQALNYHPRVFRHAHFTTGDLVAWMAIAAESRQKGDALKFFSIMVQSFLPGFSIISLEAVPKKHAGKPTKTIYLHRSFQYIPAGADLAFYFDGNHGNFLSLQGDSIVLTRPEGIVDGQQHAALVLFSDANVDASDLRMHQTKADITMRKVLRETLERSFVLSTSAKATDAEVQAVGVSTIRNLIARLERDSFLEAQRKLLESKPALLIELLPERLVSLVIEYFNDDSYPVIVSTHCWLLKYIHGIAVDSARLYVITVSNGLKGLNHSLGNIKEGERHCIEFGNPRWFGFSQFSSSHDGRYVFFSYVYDEASTDHGKHFKDSSKWLTKRDELEDKRLSRVMFDGEDLDHGLLSPNGRVLFSYNREVNPITRVYRVEEEAGEGPVGLMKFELNGAALAVSDKGNRVMVVTMRQLEIHDIGKDASRLICRIRADVLWYLCALNEDGSAAAFAKEDDDELQVVDVDKVVGDKADQPAIVTVKVPELFGQISKLVYSDRDKLHVLHVGGRVSLFDPSTKELVLLEVPQGGQSILESAISPNANYIAILQKCYEEDQTSSTLRTMVKRKLNDGDCKDLFGCEATNTP